MSKQSIRNGFGSGATFGVVIIFLVLTGFTVIAATLVAKFFGQAPKASQMPTAIYLLIFMALLGIWNGSNAAKPDLGRAGISASLIAGAIVSVITAVLALVFGTLLTNKVDPRPYLSEVSPDAMKLFLLQKATGSAVFVHFMAALISSLAGGLLTVFLREAQIKNRISTSFVNLLNKVQQSSIMIKIRHSPFTIYVGFALIAALLFFLPRQWGSYWNYIIGTVGIYVILGLGLNIITGLAGQLVLGYVAFFAIGAYSVALLTSAAPHNLQWNFWIALLISIVLAVLTGILLGLPILRLRGDYLAIVTLGFGEIIRIMLRSDLLTWLTAGPKGVRDIASPTIFGKGITSDIDFLYLIIVAVLFTIFITNRLQNSRAGRAWVAIREDEIAARAAGINTFQSKLLALAIGAAFAGLGGALFASRNQFTGPEDHVMMVSINVLALVIVGGMGSIPGIILGAFALKGLPEILRELESYRMMVFGGLLVMMMILRPEGLWPATRPNLESSGAKPTPEKADTVNQPINVKEA